jgi:hypothetical protein
MAPAEPEASTRAPDVTTARAAFWSDDFDMDLLRLVPEVPELLGDTGARTLYVRGGTSHGRLNHPAAWLDSTNTDDGTNGTEGSHVAFFGHRGPAEPPGYSAGQPVVACTVEEALRDAWAHSLRVVVDDVLVFDGAAFQGPFQDWMYVLRGWGNGGHGGAVAQVRQTRARLVEAITEARRTLETMEVPTTTALRVSTARMGTHGLLNAVDVTRKSAKGDGLAFAPSWAILNPALEARERAERLRVALQWSEATTVLDEAWREYRPRYLAEMRESYRRDRGPWERLLAMGHATLLCYCRDPSRCHRTLLARDILPKLGAIYGYEVR